MELGRLGISRNELLAIDQASLSQSGFRFAMNFRELRFLTPQVFHHLERFPEDLANYEHNGKRDDRTIDAQPPGVLCVRERDEVRRGRSWGEDAAKRKIRAGETSPGASPLVLFRNATSDLTLRMNFSPSALRDRQSP